MKVIQARNVAQALHQGLNLLKNHGVVQQTRGGLCVVYPTPVATHYTFPRERVLFWPERDANPFFHFFEGLWMLAGRNDVAFVAQFVRRMEEFSDDGVVLHGAYGHRWRNPTDQLHSTIKLLRDCPETRRAVITMWRDEVDMFDHEAGHKDVPCNTQIYFWREERKLHMTTTCRSNDIIWGAYGANAVHFSMLHEYMAAGVGVAVGQWWQISNNYHAYKTVMDPLVAKGIPIDTGDQPYITKEIEPYPMVDDFKTWDMDLKLFMVGRWNHFDNPFFGDVAVPLMRCHRSYRAGDHSAAYGHLSFCMADDWRMAAREWLERRAAK